MHQVFCDDRFSIFIFSFSDVSNFFNKYFYTQNFYIPVFCVGTVVPMYYISTCNEGMWRTSSTEGEPTQAGKLGLAARGIARSVRYRRPVAQSLYLGLCTLIDIVRHPETSTVTVYDLTFQPMPPYSMSA